MCCFCNALFYTFALSVPAFQDVYLGTAASPIQLCVWPKLLIQFNGDYCTPASNLDTKRNAVDYTAARSQFSACLSNTLYTFYIPWWLPGPLGSPDPWPSPPSAPLYPWVCLRTWAPLYPWVCLRSGARVLKGLGRVLGSGEVS